jgi:hypothetical protein
VIFSLLHPTIRLPEGWQAASDEWYAACDNPDEVEYVLCTEWPVPPAITSWKHFVQIDNGDRRCSTMGWNKAGAASTGQFLITIADDFAPCLHWDTELLKVIPDLKGQYVIAVNMGGFRPDLLMFTLMTRPYYERYGYVWYPEYKGMYADDDFTAVAKRDGVIINARHLFFEHRHPSYGTAPDDAAYRWENRPEAYKHGEQVFARRKRDDFKD